MLADGRSLCRFVVKKSRVYTGEAAELYLTHEYNFSMSFSKEHPYMLPFEGSHETEEMTDLRARIRHVLGEYIDAVQRSTDQGELERVLRTLEIGAPSLRRPGAEDRAELKRIRRHDTAWTPTDDPDMADPATTQQRAEDIKQLSDKQLVSAWRSYKEWLAGRSDLYFLSSPASRPTERDLALAEREMRRRRLL